MSWTSPRPTPAPLTSQEQPPLTTFTRSDGSASTRRRQHAWSRTRGARASWADALRLGNSVTLPPTRQGTGGPPVHGAQQPHRGRNQQGAHDGGIDQDGDEHAYPDHLHDHDAGGGKSADNNGEQDRRAGNDPATALQSDGHRRRVVAGTVPLLADPGYQEDLVVHGQAEDDGKHEDGLGGVQVARRGEAERP